jgi:hypothetical protein
LSTAKKQNPFKEIAADQKKTASPFETAEAVLSILEPPKRWAMSRVFYLFIAINFSTIANSSRGAV